MENIMLYNICKRREAYGHYRIYRVHKMVYAKLLTSSRTVVLQLSLSIGMMHILVRREASNHLNQNILKTGF